MKDAVLNCPMCTYYIFYMIQLHENLCFMYCIQRMNQKHAVNYAACVSPYLFAVEDRDKM